MTSLRSALLCTCAFLLGAASLHAYRAAYPLGAPLGPPTLLDPAGASFSERSEPYPCQGPVILSLGQSLSANENTGAVPSVAQVNLLDGKCYRRQGPLLGTTGTRSNWLSYLPLTVFPIAYSASFASYWSPGGILYPRLEQALRILNDRQLPLAAVFWQQGEAEGAMLNPDPATYKAAVLSVVRTIRLAQPTAPFYVSQSTVCRNVGSAVIRQAQRELPDPPLGILPGPVTDTIPPSERSDGCHLNEAGMKHMARLWMEALPK